MPSFDVVSEVDQHELQNAVDQLKRELDNRFDFRGVSFEVKQQKESVELIAPEEFQVKQMLEVFKQKAAGRGIDVKCLDPQPVDKNLARALMPVQVRQGIDKDTAKTIVKQIKNSKVKVQASIQGEQVRVTGKKRDDLQSTIALLKEAELSIPLQFNNFRD